MKCRILVLLTGLLITSCLALENGKAKNGKNKKNNDLLRYITNWDTYQIPTPVTVIALKDILEKIALYKQKLYCPFGEDNCVPHQYGLSEIVTQIVKDSVAATANDSKDLDDHKATIKQNVNEAEEKKKKDSVRTHNLKRSYSETELNEIESILTKILQFGSSINNKSLMSALKTLKLVYGARYHILKSRAIANEKNKSEQKKLKKRSTYYITNWDQYNLPTPIPVEVLKETLTKIALYKRNEFCPFGINMCDQDQVSLGVVTAKIVNDIVANFNKRNGNIDNHEDYSKMTGKELKMKLATLTSKETVDKNMVDGVLHVLQLSNQINSDELKNARILLKGRYKSIKPSKFENEPKRFLKKFAIRTLENVSVHIQH